MAQIWGGGGNPIVPMSFGKSLDRMNGQPLDPSAIISGDTFEAAYANAEAYAKTPNAYVGMILSVSDGHITRFYGITNEAGDLEPVGASDLTELQSQVTQLRDTVEDLHGDEVHIQFVKNVDTDTVNAEWGTRAWSGEPTISHLCYLTENNIPIRAIFYDCPEKNSGYANLTMDASESDEYVLFYGWYHGRIIQIRIDNQGGIENIPICYLELADNLVLDRQTGMLYLMSSGRIISKGVQIMDGEGNSAVMTLENTTGWANKTVSNTADCIVSFNWSSVEEGADTGSGTVIVKVGGEVRHSAEIRQGQISFNIIRYLSLGHNLVHITVSDVYGNCQTISLSVNMYDPKNLKSTQLVERTLSGDYENDRVTNVGAQAFRDCNALTGVSLPNVTSVSGNSTFDSCSSMRYVYLPNLTSLSGVGYFGDCSSLIDFNFASLQSYNNYGGMYVPAAVLDFPSLTSISGSRGFSGATNLQALVLRASSCCTLQCSENVGMMFAGTPILEGTGYIYVPTELLESYKIATNWSVLGDQFRPLEEYTVDGTITGELDYEKMGVSI